MTDAGAVPPAGGVGFGDRILRTRLESMEMMLLRFQTLEADVGDARKELDDLSNEIKTACANLGQLTVLSGKVHSALEGMREAQTIALWHAQQDSRNVEELMTFVEELKLEAVCKRAESLKQSVGSLRNDLEFKTRSAIQRARRWDTPAETGVNIDRELCIMAESLRERLQRAHSQSDPWGYYFAEVRDDCDDFSSDYVDLVGGIALRDQGLERRVSRDASTLVSLLLTAIGSRGVLAVPGTTFHRRIDPSPARKDPASAGLDAVESSVGRDRCG